MNLFRNKEWGEWYSSEYNGSCEPLHGNHPFANETFITGAYEGIPQTLTIYAVCWVALIALFAVLRRTAWNYGRLALVQRGGGWTRLFYSGSGHGESEGEVTVREGEPEIDAGYWSWVPAVVLLKRDQIAAKCGPDAVHYLSFQRHLIALMTFITAVALCVVLPINFRGDLEGDRRSFGHTTLGNLDPKSPWLWVHTVLCFAYLPVSVLLMRRCTGRKPLPEHATRSLMISGIAKRDRDATAIKNHLRRLFPQVGILDVQLAYDTHRLIEVDEKRELAAEARLFSENYRRRTGKSVEVRTSTCGLRGETEDGERYYAEREERFTGETERIRAAALSSPLGIAFVTLSSDREVDHVLTDFRASSRLEWIVDRAPAPTDIYWQNLNVEPGVWYLKAFLVNFVLFLSLFFLTTPAIVVSMINTLYADAKIVPVLSEFLPTPLLWLATILLPLIVSYSDQWLSHWTRSQETYSIMMKTFVFLLLMTLILPSLGLTSAQAFVEWTFQEGNGTYRWKCVFLPDRGAFFVSYVMFCGLIATPLELIRFSELFLYVCYLARSRSKAEKGSVQKAILLEFPFGVNYAWTLVVFTITTVYSVPCPLIAPFGLLYLILKHFGDKHNLYFAYGFSDMSGTDGGKIHATAVRLVRVAVLLLQICMAALAGVRGGMDARTVVLILFTLVTFGSIVILHPFPSCRSQSRPLDLPPPVYSKYVAPVLLKNIRRHSDLIRISDYGSSGDRDPDPRPSAGSAVNA